MAEQLNGDDHGRTPHQLILSNSNTIELPGDALKIPRRSRVRFRFFFRRGPSLAHEDTARHLGIKRSGVPKGRRGEAVYSVARGDTGRRFIRGTLALEGIFTLALTDPSPLSRLATNNHLETLDSHGKDVVKLKGLAPPYVP